MIFSPSSSFSSKTLELFIFKVILITFGYPDLCKIFNVLVNYKDGKMGYVSLEDVVGAGAVVGAASSNNRTIPMDDELIQVARDMGMCLGD